MREAHRSGLVDDTEPLVHKKSLVRPDWKWIELFDATDVVVVQMCDVEELFQSLQRVDEANLIDVVKLDRQLIDGLKRSIRRVQE